MQSGVADPLLMSKAYREILWKVRSYLPQSLHHSSTPSQTPASCHMVIHRTGSRKARLLCRDLSLTFNPYPRRRRCQPYYNRGCQPVDSASPVTQKTEAINETNSHNCLEVLLDKSTKVAGIQVKVWSLIIVAPIVITHSIIG